MLSRIVKNALVAVALVATSFGVTSCTRHNEVINKAESGIAEPRTQLRAPSKDVDTNDVLIRIREHGLYGFIDEAGGVRIKTRFLEVGDFAHGLAPARTAGRYGYIDKKGEWVIQPRYDYATTFAEGRAVGFIDTIAYMLDLDGKARRIGVFDGAAIFHYGFVVLQKGKHRALVNTEGSILANSVDVEYRVLTPTRVFIRPRILDSHGLTRSTGIPQIIDNSGKVIKKLPEYAATGINVSVKSHYNAPVFVFPKVSGGILREDILDTNGNYVSTVPESFGVVSNVLRSGYVQTGTHRLGNGAQESPNRILDRHGRVVKLDSAESVTTFGARFAQKFDERSRQYQLVDLENNYKKKTIHDVRSCHNLNQHVLVETGRGVVVIDEKGLTSAPLQISPEAGVAYADSTYIIAAEAVDIESDPSRMNLLYFNRRWNSRPTVRFDDAKLIAKDESGNIHASVNDVVMVIRRDGYVLWRTKEWY